jgi:hypothetical protein
MTGECGISATYGAAGGAKRIAQTGIRSLLKAAAQLILKDWKIAVRKARISPLQIRLKLTPAQEKNWPALETALREQVKRAPSVSRNGATRPRNFKSIAA